MNFLENSIVLNNIGVFIFFTVLIIILALFIPRECNSASEDGECNRRPCNRLLKRDFIYCVAILILCIIFVATFVMGDCKNIYDYLSFASTVTSIILSVLAITMTLLAESKNDATKGQIEHYVNKVEVFSKDTDEQIKKIDNIYKQMQERFDTYKTIVDQQNNLLIKQEQLKKDLDKIIKRTEDILEQTQKINKSLSENKTYIMDEKQIDERTVKNKGTDFFGKKEE